MIIQGSTYYLEKYEEGKDLVYIGEAENILNRINQHINQKDFWNETIVFVSKDENLNKAHIKYLEHRLHKIAKSVNRYAVVNNVTPTQSSISEPDQAEMEEFLQNIKLLVNTLGHKVFEEKRELTTTKNKETFKINAARGANAEGEPSADGFVVFERSKAAGSTVPSMTSNFIKLRDDLIEEGAIKSNNGSYGFADDYIFSSPSTAASIVLGRNANGLTEWKLSDGTTLKEFESN